MRADNSTNSIPPVNVTSRRPAGPPEAGEGSTTAGAAASPSATNIISRSSLLLVLGMGACYALGNFTDNFYKQAAVLLAADQQLTWVQSIAAILFSLPYILFSAWAGWLADRLVKKHIVIAAKTVELLALGLGCFALVAGNWFGILAVIFFMGVQATAFSPALNGSIPEYFPAEQVPRVNSLIKLASTAAILLGIGASGLLLDLRPGGLLPSFGFSGASGPEAVDAAVNAAGSGTVYGRWAAGIFGALVAAVGLLTAFSLKRRAPAVQKGQADNPFPWSGPVDSMRHFMECRKDEQLFLVLLAEGYFYGVAAMAVVSMANLSTALGYSKTVAALLQDVLMVGVAVGAIFAGRLAADSWKRVLFPSALGMGLFLSLLFFSPFMPRGAESALPLIGNPQICWMTAMLFACGVCGGVYLIPLASFIQVRPAPSEKGKIIGVSNFFSFAAIAVWGGIFALAGLLPAEWTFVFYGATTAAFAVFVIGRRLSRMGELSLKDLAVSGLRGPLGLILRFALCLRYRVHETGLDRIPALRPAAVGNGAGTKKVPGILFLPNHPALIDPIIVYSRLAGLSPRPLADAGQMRGPLQRFAAKMLHAVVIPDLLAGTRADAGASARAIREALSHISSALQNGDNVLLYPSGRIYRSGRENLGANSAVAHILAETPEARVVLVRTRGLWGSSFSRAAGRTPTFMSELLKGMLTVFANGIFFTPRRHVDITFVEPDDLPRTAEKMALNAWLEDFYNEAETPAFAVPRGFRQGRQPVPLPESGQKTPADNGRLEIPEEVREAVYRILREEADLPDDVPVSPEQTLSGDLGLDSLAVMTVAAGIEMELDQSVPNLDALVTVEDCLAAAVGRFALPEDGAVSAPEAWFSPDKSAAGEEPVFLPAPGPAAAVDAGRESIKGGAVTASITGAAPADNIVRAFLHHARTHPKRPLTGEKAGLRTRKEILIGALVLAKRFAALPGKRLGLMLPATPAALVAWLAVLLAGKEPVMLNWTAGRNNMEHCLRLTGITHAVTASRVLDQLSGQGYSLEGLPLEWTLLDKTAASIRPAEKIRGFARAQLHCLGLVPLRADQVPAVAAILFTSGSEAAPKGVPLTHANITANIKDLVGIVGVRQKDRVLAMLPPFHSFGLLVGLALPACTGTAVAYHPNPTESAPLVSLMRSHRLTLTASTPTFLAALLKRAEGTDALESLRFCFVGAEKCPDHVYRAFSRVCPRASLCEGYGITECSPVISVNRPGNTVAGTVGLPLPSVQIAVVREEDGAAEGVRRTLAAPDEQGSRSGVLLARGPNIFSGYLSDGRQTPPDPFVPFAGEMWYRTGDIVEQDTHGRLTFKGRLKRFVKVGGEMISLPQMESALLEALNARPNLNVFLEGADAAAAGGASETGGTGKAGGEAPLLALEVRPGSENAGRPEILAFTPLMLTVQDINRILREAGFSALYSVQRVVRVPVIPLLGTGKTDYRALQRLV